MFPLLMAAGKHNIIRNDTMGVVSYKRPGDVNPNKSGRASGQFLHVASGDPRPVISRLQHMPVRLYIMFMPQNCVLCTLCTDPTRNYKSCTFDGHYLYGDPDHTKRCDRILRSSALSHRSVHDPMA